MLADVRSLIQEITIKNHPYSDHPGAELRNLYKGSTKQNIALEKLFQQPKMREWLKEHEQEIIRGYRGRCVKLDDYIGLALSKSPDNYDNAQNAARLLKVMLIMKEREGYMYYDRSDEKINKFLENFQFNLNIDETKEVDNFRFFYRGKSGEEILLLAGNDATKTIKTSEKYPQDYGVFYTPGNSDYPGSDMVSVRTPDGTFKISRTCGAKECRFPIVVVEEKRDTFQRIFKERSQ